MPPPPQKDEGRAPAGPVAVTSAAASVTALTRALIPTLASSAEMTCAMLTSLSSVQAVMVEDAGEVLGWRVDPGRVGGGQRHRHRVGVGRGDALDRGEHVGGLRVPGAHVVQRVGHVGRGQRVAVPELDATDKIGNVAPYTVSGRSGVQGIVTDAPADHPTIQQFRQQDVEILPAS